MSIVLSNIEVSLGNVVVDINKYLQMLTQRITAVEKQIREMTKTLEPVKPISSMQNELIILRKLEQCDEENLKKQNALKELLLQPIRGQSPALVEPVLPLPAVQAPVLKPVQAPVQSNSINIQVDMNKYLQMLTFRITDVERKLRELQKKP